MPRRIRKKLFYQVFIYYALPLLLLAVIGTGAVLSYTNYLFFQKNIEKNYSQILAGAAGEIRMYMEVVQRDMETLAQMMVSAKLDAWNRDMLLAAFRNRHDPFETLMFLSPDGGVQATTWIEGMPRAGMEESLRAEVFAGKTAMSPVLVSADGVPHLHLAVPVPRLGELIGVLWADLNLKSVWDILNGIAIGKTGQVFILDLSGKYVGHPDIARVIRGAGSSRPEVLERIRASSGSVAWMENRDGKKFYCMGVYIDSVNWVVALEQEVPEIYSFLRENIFWALGIVLAIVLLGAWVAWLGTRRLLAPVQDLHTRIAAVGAGDLTEKADEDREDELGDLARAFNRMTESIGGYIRREIEMVGELAHAKNLAQLGVAASKVTHEVGNLLNNMGIILPALKTEALSPSGEKRLSLLEKDADRLHAFITDFLQFARKPALQMRPAFLDRPIRDLFFEYQPKADACGITLSLDWAEDVPPLPADHYMLYQVFNNLLKNALAAMGEKGEVRISGRMEGPELVVRVADTGPGMAPEVLQKIFEPFFTTKGKQGTGLGLSIVQGVMQAHGGSISCESAPGKGTCFTLRFPLRDISKEAPAV